MTNFEGPLVSKILAFPYASGSLRLIQILPLPLGTPSLTTLSAPAVGAILGRIFDPNLNAVFFADLLDIFALSC